MLAKKTSKNQITLPKTIVDQLPAADYFDISLRNDEIILKPVSVVPIGTGGTTARRWSTRARAKIKALGLTEKDVNDAIRWARGR
jgi:hypothetical protein